MVGLVLAPHYSRISIGGYRERLEEALDGRAELVFVESWHDHEPYVDLLAERVRGTDAHVVFTAHSLPERILAEGDPYRDQLLETSRLVADRAGVSDWSFAFQSESPTGEPWLGPDILVELETLHAAACARCWSLPSASSATTSRSSRTSTSRPGTRRQSSGSSSAIESLNADPAFISALADLVEKASGAERRIGVR